MSKTKKNNNRPLKLIGLVVVAIVGVFSFSLITDAAPGKNSKTIIKNTSGPNFGLYINPASTTVKTGNKITVDVKANLSTNPVQAISVLVHFNPSILRLDSIDQSKVDNSYSMKTACSSTNGCKKPGDLIMIVGYIGNGTIQPKNGILVGSLKFTTLKQGTTSVIIDNNTKLSGFTSKSVPQNVLDARQTQNGYVNISKSVVK